MESDKGPHSSASGEQSKEDSPAHPRSTSLPSLPRLAIQPTIARLRISGLTNVPGMADESPLTTAPSSPTDQRAEWLSAEENAGSEGDETEGGEPAGDAGEGASQMGDADGPVGSDPCICHVDEECHCRDVLEGVFDGDDPKDRTYQGVEVTGTADDCSASDDDSDSESDSSSSTGSESTACSTDREGNRVSVDRRASRERSSGSDSVGGGSLAEVEGGEEEEDGVRGEEQGEQVEDVEDDGPSRKRRKVSHSSQCQCQSHCQCLP